MNEKEMERLGELFEQIEIEYRIITPEDAAEILRYHKQNYRKIAPMTVAHYARIQTKGKWGFNIADPLVFIEETGRTHPVTKNGQHRLSAQIKSGTTQPYMVIVLNKKTRDLYDDKIVDWGMKRTVADYFLDNDLGDALTANVATFVHWQTAGGESSRRPIPEEVAQTYMFYKDGVDFAASLENCPRKKGVSIAARGVIVRGYYNTNDRERLVAFGHMLGHGMWTEPEADSGVRLLRDLIAENRNKGQGSGAGGRSHISRYAESALYAFLNRKHVKLLRRVKRPGNLLPLPANLALDFESLD